MKNNFLIIPSKKSCEKVANSHFLFPLKDFCVGFLHTYEIDSVDSFSYAYINRILDNEGIKKLKEILEKHHQMKGIVFEDLGILELIKELKLNVETIFYPTHAACSTKTINTYLEFVDSVVISPDITKEEIDNIIKNASKKVSLYTYGPLPYMYSRRTLLTNYQNHFNLPLKKKEHLEENVTKKQFVMIENEYGTVCFDAALYDGRIFLNQENIKYHIINLDWEENVNYKDFMISFENQTIPNTFKGFLEQKTIYKLPPRKEE